MRLCECLQGVSRFLDRAGAADRAAIKAHAQQAQYDEYDDEYDDSYDDLGGPSADGVADVEGGPLKDSCDARTPYPGMPGHGCARMLMPMWRDRSYFSAINGASDRQKQGGLLTGLP